MREARAKLNMLNSLNRKTITAKLLLNFQRICAL